jgi:hypothetical protein
VNLEQEIPAERSDVASEYEEPAMYPTDLVQAATTRLRYHGCLGEALVLEMGNSIVDIHVVAIGVTDNNAA